MSYIIAILAMLVFSAIYIISYRINSKVNIDCEKKGCEGCLNQGCINRVEKEDK